ncbi:hypothetical protein SAMN05216376_108192 [Mameliella alba]|uniref:hypothetical protein n=1 Tax=Mameliella TaxID=1434019 RepID=UPI0008881059|nr:MULTISPECIES: hypothetical protein [Mameliella]MCR9273878.1 hypothetical protein [Paracoccaceae bacterium]OWV62111.1 hypothetical protein CDZ98_06420 [Mameliella alba]PTR38858.1 hypothetical protein LX94_02780 [Mameliella alba]SDD45402.1 hypothetical protein SAMN05216376_108192 [Mameliella alba]GGF70023.1 hypothetical protein GCM10011319_33400 [Mameliella alba]
MTQQDWPAHVTRLVDEELADFAVASRGDRLLLEDFARMRVRRPRPITVNFSGGLTDTCYSVTRSNGAYSVLFLPKAGYFSLCVDSDFGPLDIGVHGPALGCFASV